jgi:type IX secretion system PorP/SprF family membrane protein
LFSQYMYNEMFINPAYSGSREAMSATLLHRQQWLNFPGRPVTTTFSLHGPLMQNKMGVGLSVLNEKIGALSRNLAYFSYAYRIKAGKTGSLALGLMGGLHSQMQKFGDLKTSRDGSIDPKVAVNTPNISTFNFGAGLYYSTKTFYAGLSVPRMINDQLAVNSSGDGFARNTFDPSAMHYYFTIGKVFDVNEDLLVKTTAMAKTVAGAPPQADVSANFLFNKVLWLGAAYRTGAAATAILGVQASPRFYIGYSYDIDLNRLHQYTGGSHEVVLSYLFYHDTKKVLSPRYF